ncbi:MAG: GumC family protein [Anaeromyxobacteraceae bacterium]
MERTYTVQDLFAALKRRRRLALAVAGVVLVATAAVILTLPKEYRASSVTQVEPHRLPPEFFPTSAVSFEDRMRTLKHGLLARPVLERVIRETDFFPDLKEDLDRAVEKMRRQIEVRLEGEVASGPPALLFVVDVKGDDAQKVAKAAELLPRYYAEMTAGVLAAQAKSLKDTLQRQVEQMGAQLSEQEKKLLAYTSDHATEVPAAAENNMRATARVAALMQMRLEAMHDAQRRRTEALMRVPEMESEPGRAQGAREDAKRRLEAARAAYGADHPDVKRLERAYADVAARADEQEARYRKERLDATVGRIDAEIAANQREYERLSQELAGYQKKLDLTPSRGEALRGMSREYEVLRAKYTTSLARAADAAAAEQLLRADAANLFRTVQPAIAPSRPAGPEYLKLLLVALAAALAAGFLAAAAAEYLDSSLRGPEDATQLGAPVLAAIPRIAAGRRTA